MPDNDSFWDFYWETRLQAMETLGKRESILTAARLIRQMAQAGGPVRLLELGCGEGQIIGTLVEGHPQVSGISQSVGVDYSAAAIKTCRRSFPQMRFIEGDFTRRDLLEPLGTFEIILLVNALHEVFSATFSDALNEVDVPAAKARVVDALLSAVERLAPGGVVLLFDGLEPPGDPQTRLRVRFHHAQALEHFRTFVREFRPFHITYRETNDPFCVDISRRDFTRYIDKSIFLGKGLWKTERLESYQYFTQDEFRAAFALAGLVVKELRTLTVNDQKWENTVEIETPGEHFPEEHILIVAQKG